MNLARHKSFRIESAGISHVERDDDETGSTRHRELLDAIVDLRERVAPQEVSAELISRYKAELKEAAKIKTELDAIYGAIADTKREIATLHQTGFDEVHMTAVSNELDAVVEHTEHATETILSAAEQIDSSAANLAAALSGTENEMASDIQDQVVKVFEACNFQDVTGQRITKVVNTLKFIEHRVSHMIEIWGGMEGFEGVAPIEQEEPEGDRALLNGPALDDDPDRADQDAIDALFD